MSDFTDAIERNWPDYVIATGGAASCPDCLQAFGLDTDNDIDANQEAIYDHDEPHFSWSECDSCGSRLGGDRSYAHAIHREAFGPNAKRPNDVHHISICVDCLMFHANGDEPEAWEG